MAFIMKQVTDTYNAASLSVLKGLEPVRVHPGMYTDTHNPNHIAQEVIDNSVDEALAGHATHIKVTLLEDGGLCVEDDGRGMPIDVHPEQGISGVELIMTQLHAGGKFSDKNYTYSGGLHGVGISVVNALSHQMIVEVKRQGVHCRMCFESGKKTTDLLTLGQIPKKQSGTFIKFYPDQQFFDTADFDIPKLMATLKAKAVLCPGLTLELYQPLTDSVTSWYYPSGILTYFEAQLSEEVILPEQAWTGADEAETCAVQWAVAWHLEGNPLVSESYVNVVQTEQGGTHVNGLKAGLCEAIRQFCETHDLLPRGLKLKPEDIWSKVNYILSAKVLKPQFLGQTKERLMSKNMTQYVSRVVENAFSLWLNQNMQAAEALTEYLIDIAQQRLKQAKKIVRKKVGAGPALPGKLTDCTHCYDQDSELFLVEGDSAGGSARQARDREIQAVMPLRGKILNTWEVASEEVLASQTVHDIAVAIGVDPGSTDLSRCRYGKVCILADADSDGLHISTLLCALFLKHFKPLVKDGRVFVAMPPLYRIDVGQKVYYALDDVEKDRILVGLSESDQNRASVQRFKGLGEMNPSQLRETTMAVDTRKLVQLKIDETDTDDQMLDLLLAKKRSEDRRTWLEEKGDLAQSA
jgi:topoisomerase IV subunit B